MAQQSKTATDHDTIRRWAEERNGKPAVVTREGEQTELLRVNFPGYSEGDLEEIEWDRWFEIFDRNGLALVYQEETEDGERSNFNKLISRKKTDQE